MLCVAVNILYLTGYLSYANGSEEKREHKHDNIFSLRKIQTSRNDRNEDERKATTTHTHTHTWNNKMNDNNSCSLKVFTSN